MQYFFGDISLFLSHFCVFQMVVITRSAAVSVSFRKCVGTTVVAACQTTSTRRNTASVSTTPNQWLTASLKDNVTQKNTKIIFFTNLWIFTCYCFVNSHSSWSALSSVSNRRLVSLSDDHVGPTTNELRHGSILSCVLQETWWRTLHIGTINYAAKTL